MRAEARTATVEGARRAFKARAWTDAYALLQAADRESPLDPGDLERLAAAARLIGQDAESIDLMARAHQEHLARGDEDEAARSACWIATRLVLDGESAQASGWVARGRRLLDENGECVAQGYLPVPLALRASFAGDQAAACASFGEAAEIGDRFGDRDLATFGRLGQGRSLIRLGDIARGTALLDEVMVGVTAGEVSPVFVGDMYCAVIEGCHDIFDFRRAQEWTDALTRWCESQPDLARYRGVCLIRRAELMQLHGAWPDALHEAELARDTLSGPPVHRGAGVAWYEMAELHRLRGEVQAAEECYQEGHRLGCDPHPGLALLRLAQGRTAAAAAAMRRMIGETGDRRERARALGPHVEIMLAAGDVAAARRAAEELSSIAATVDAPFLHALAAHGHGAVLLAEGEPRAALAALRDAAAAWRQLEMPYEVARVRALTGLAHRALGDEDTAGLELEAARLEFARLGAPHDLRRVEALLRPAEPPVAGVLTAREVEVLRLVATGGANRAIAERLGISEKTVARHLSNIFTKLGISSRAAATAYAYRNEILTANG